MPPSKRPPKKTGLTSPRAMKAGNFLRAVGASTMTGRLVKSLMKPKTAK